MYGAYGGYVRYLYSPSQYAGMIAKKYFSTRKIKIEKVRLKLLIRELCFLFTPKILEKIK